ncbi:MULTISPECIES: hypothetical protein [Paraburkholderia]|uniref:hypothetical protein n=1 Tax=Paraburkholderia TaxID=1822464 RepID=UPI000377510A|nr:MULTISPECIES: hypothetical protein [Paraburkholderia]MDH6150543.1 hypothetical protein [Paraburkholderia sp. WSM4179]
MAATKKAAANDAPKTDSAPPAKRDPKALHLSQVVFKDAEERGAVMASSAVIRGAVTGRKYAEPMFGAELDLTAYARELRKQADAVKAGDLSTVEAMLITQANTLDMMFNQLARKAAHSEYLNQMEANLRLALKAQAQCRSTLEALAEIKNPRPVAFVKQQNVGHNVQVNNGTAPPTVARAHEESDDQSNKLLEHQHGEWLDTGAAGEAGRGNQAMEAVGAVNRAEN